MRKARKVGERIKVTPGSIEGLIFEACLDLGIVATEVVVQTGIHRVVGITPGPPAFEMPGPVRGGGRNDC